MTVATETRPVFDRKDYRILAPEEDIIAVRQQMRNAFVERCRLMHLPIPAPETLERWWPGTRAVFA